MVNVVRNLFVFSSGHRNITSSRQRLNASGRLRLLPAFLVPALLLLLCGCIIGVERGKYVEGRTLTVGVTQVRKVGEIGYQQDNQHFVIKPKDPEKNILAIASVSVANYRSARVLMHLDRTSAYLDDQKNQRFQALDPYQQRDPLEKAVKDEGLYVPFLWGTFELNIDQQITGWMVFEVPKESEAIHFGWQQGENIVVRFCKEPC